jgi:hypothetical protein
MSETIQLGDGCEVGQLLECVVCRTRFRSGDVPNVTVTEWESDYKLGDKTAVGTMRWYAFCPNCPHLTPVASSIVDEPRPPRKLWLPLRWFMWLFRAWGLLPEKGQSL